MGVRSFEAGEKELLDRLGVRIFYVDEINVRGFDVCFQEALARVTRGTAGFGMSIDLDGFDPLYAPGVGTPAPGGLSPQDVLPSLASLGTHPMLKAIELVEFNPELDHQDSRTRHLALQLTETILAPQTSHIELRHAM